MTRPIPLNRAPIPMQRRFDVEYRRLVDKALDFIKQLDPAEPSTLQFAVCTLARLGVQHKDIASSCGVSRTSIGRWAKGANIPRSAGFRVWAVEKLAKDLAAIR